MRITEEQIENGTHIVIYLPYLGDELRCLLDTGAGCNFTTMESIFPNGSEVLEITTHEAVFESKHFGGDVLLGDVNLKGIALVEHIPFGFPIVLGTNFLKNNNIALKLCFNRNVFEF